mgnify:CR=1 FL=1
MTSLLKDNYDHAYVSLLGERINAACSEFDETKFLALVFDELWSSRELKARMMHIRKCIHTILNRPYVAALEVLRDVAVYFSGFEAMIFPDYVQTYGLDCWQLSIDVLEEFTQYSSSEFAVRPFIERDSELMMSVMVAWAGSKNHHVRRLASEGCRPRLPWARPLKEFKRDPSAILPILEKLKSDESDYVRKSVANNLNDISKDNPQLVLDICCRWKGLSENVDRLVKHGCRTLLKKGDASAMKLFGYQESNGIKVSTFQLDVSHAKVGGYIDLILSLDCSVDNGPIRLEYAIDFVKSAGHTSNKVFMLRDGLLADRELCVKKRHSFKQLSTRKHYPGEHVITVIVNGVRLQSKTFYLSGV